MNLIVRWTYPCLKSTALNISYEVQNNIAYPIIYACIQIALQFLNGPGWCWVISKTNTSNISHWNSIGYICFVTQAVHEHRNIVVHLLWSPERCVQRDGNANHTFTEFCYLAKYMFHNLHKLAAIHLPLLFTKRSEYLQPALLWRQDQLVGSCKNARICPCCCVYTDSFLCNLTTTNAVEGEEGLTRVGPWKVWMKDVQGPG